MWHIHPTEQWLDDVIIKMNENQLNPDESKFMIAFFSSMDNQFVEYFQSNKNQISSFSGQNFHICTPMIMDDKILPDHQWRYMRQEFNSLGIPVGIEPTFVFFKLENNDTKYEPNFFAGFECKNFIDFPKKLKTSIEIGITNNVVRTLINKLTEVFLSENIIINSNVGSILRDTITNKLPENKIFISHSSIDKQMVRRIENELTKEKSLKFWIDKNEILVGDDIQKAISQGLKESDYLIIIISENSVKSNWVNFELSQFMGLTENQNIIPIVLDKESKFSEPINNLIQRLKYLDFSEDSNWESNIEELKRKLNK